MCFLFVFNFSFVLFIYRLPLLIGSFYYLFSFKLNFLVIFGFSFRRNGFIIILFRITLSTIFTERRRKAKLEIDSIIGDCAKIKKSKKKL